MTAKMPAGLAPAGRALWRSVSDSHDLDDTQRVQLLEVCRAKDRLDKLDLLLRGDVDSWASLTHDLRTESYVLRIDAALAQANATANLMKQLIAALRLPDDVTGKRPQKRGPRGVLPPRVIGVSSLDRARAS